MSKISAKSFGSPDEVRTFEKGKIEIVNFPDSGVTIGRGTLEPGWSWEKCIKPLVKTDSCQALHYADFDLELLYIQKSVEDGRRYTTSILMFNFYN